ncbi:MAG: GIY-YIG nuclease family protein [Pirellulales bacterium]|nr:GIY-YIG nuclease family protein [Pirellulales bacterium]
MSDGNIGIVYVVSNPAMPGIVKIGITAQDNVDQRIKQLFTTSVPVPFECEYACKVTDYETVEKALQIAFSPNRINPQREFFNIEPEQAIVILKLLSKEDITPQVVKEYEAEMDPDDVEAGKHLKKQRRPRLNFTEMGIEIGSILKFIEGEIEVVVSSDKKIVFHQEEMSLTKATREILKLDFNIQPTKYWIYNGVNLFDIYNNTYEEIES